METIVGDKINPQGLSGFFVRKAGLVQCCSDTRSGADRSKGDEGVRADAINVEIGDDFAVSALRWLGG